MPDKTLLQALPAVDTYLKSTDEQALLDLLAFITNMMTPTQGRDAVPEGVDESGNVTPAIPAAGDPAYYYTCVRAPFPVPAFGGILPCSAEEGIPVVGVWA